MKTPIVGKIFLIVAAAGLILASTGCGSAQAPEAGQADAAQDIAVEAQVVAEPTQTPQPTATSAPPPEQELPTEIIEPISPVSPVTTPQERSAMTTALDQEQIIPGSEEALTAAIADLADRTGIAADQIQLASMEAMEWRDSSLGCPQEGMMYAQVITPGYLIVLTADGQQFTYHTDQGPNTVLCQEE